MEGVLANLDTPSHKSLFELVAKAFVALVRDFLHHFIHVLVGLCRYTEMGVDEKLLRKFKAFLFCNDDLFPEIDLISAKANHYILWGGLLNILDPLGNGFEGLRACHVVDKQCTRCALVVLLGHSSEAFVARSVPKLQLHFVTVVNSDAFCREGR